MKQNKRSQVLRIAHSILRNMSRNKMCAYLHMAVFCLRKVLEDDTTRCTTSTGKIQSHTGKERLGNNTESNPEGEEGFAGSKESLRVNVSCSTQESTFESIVQHGVTQGNNPIPPRHRRMQQKSVPDNLNNLWGEYV